MIKGLERESVSVKRGKEMEAKAEKILDILLNASEPMRASDIALACGFRKYYEKDKGNAQSISHQLRWLRSLGLIKRIEKEGEPLSVVRYKVKYTYGWGDTHIGIVREVELRFLRHLGVTFLESEPFVTTIPTKVAYFVVAE